MAANVKEQAKTLLATLKTEGKDVPEVVRAANELERLVHNLRHFATTKEQDCASLQRELDAHKTRSTTADRDNANLQSEVDSLKQQLASAKAKRDIMPFQDQLEHIVPGRELSGENHERYRKDLVRLVERYLPDFVRLVRQPTDVIILHQDAFAGSYHAEEYALLGMLIKYAGLYGKKVIVNGTNGETFTEPSKYTPPG